GLRGGSDRLTHPARFPLRRIDAVWLRGPLTATALETGPAGSSDHLPVTAMLRTSGPGAPARCTRTASTAGHTASRDRRAATRPRANQRGPMTISVSDLLHEPCSDPFSERGL